MEKLKPNLWYVRIYGNKDDVKSFVELSKKIGIEVALDGDNYCFTSVKIMSAEKSDKALEEGERVKKRVNLSYSVINGKNLNVGCGPVVMINEMGQRNINVFVQETINVSALFVTRVEVTVTDKNGNIIQTEPAKPKETPELIILKGINNFPMVERAMGYISDTEDYSSLYKGYEVIRKDCGGDAKLSKKRYVLEDELKTLTSYLNRPDLSGDKARHAHSSGSLPKGVKEGLGPKDIRKIIIELAINWVNDKLKTGGKRLH